MPARMREGGQFSPYTSHVIEGGDAWDGQHRHMIGPRWLLHLPAGYLCIQNTEFNIIILWLGKMKKAKFLFCRHYSTLASVPFTLIGIKNKMVTYCSTIIG